MSSSFSLFDLIVGKRNLLSSFKNKASKNGITKKDQIRPRQAVHTQHVSFNPLKGFEVISNRFYAMLRVCV